jgi:hypothetical protein
MSITTGALPEKKHGIFCRIKHQFKALCKSSHYVSDANTIASQTTDSAKPIKPTHISVGLKISNIPTTNLGVDKTQSEQLVDNNNAVQAYAQNTTAPVTQASDNQSSNIYSSWYLSWANVRLRSIPALQPAANKAAFVTQAVDWAKKAMALGEEEGPKILKKIFEQSNVPTNTHINSITREGADSRVNSSTGTDDSSFWTKVVEELEGKNSTTSSTASPNLGRYRSNLSIKPLNHEIAAQFITTSKRIINKATPLPESFATKWLEHFETAVRDRKLPDFRTLEAEYEAVKLLIAEHEAAKPHTTNIDIIL